MWFKPNRPTAGARTLQKQLATLQAELATKDEQIAELREQLEIEQVRNRVAKVEIDKLAAVCARDLSRVHSETLTISETSADAGHPG